MGIADGLEAIDAKVCKRAVLGGIEGACRGRIEIGDELGIGDVPDANAAVRTTACQTTLGVDGQGIDGNVGDLEGSEDLGLFGDVFLEFLALVGFALGSPFGLDRFDFWRQFAIDIVGPDLHDALVIDRRGRRKVFAIRADSHREDTAWHGVELTDQVGIIADDASRLPEDAIDSRSSVGATDEDLIAFRMPS